MSAHIQIANCSVARTLDIVADPWTFLVMREAFFGVRRFDRILANLGLPRGTLAARLGHIVAEGLLDRVLYQTAPARYEYRLTEKGADLYPAMVTMMRWGDRWRAGPEGPPLSLWHTACRHACHALVICSHCADVIEAREVTYRNGPSAGIDTGYPRGRTRRSSRPENFLAGRPCSVARTLEVIGDRWTFLLIREAFFGVHRFEEVRRNLGVSTNILANRLQRLLEFGIFERRRYTRAPERYEYRFTDKGRDLYPSMIALMRWGDDWLWEGRGAPLLLHHTSCGNAFRPVVACSHCRGRIRIRDMRYESGLGAEEGEGDLVTTTSGRIEPAPADLMRVRGG